MSETCPLSHIATVRKIDLVKFCRIDLKSVLSLSELDRPNRTAGPFLVSNSRVSNCSSFAWPKALTTQPLKEHPDNLIALIQ